MPSFVKEERKLLPLGENRILLPGPVGTCEPGVESLHFDLEVAFKAIKEDPSIRASKPKKVAELSQVSHSPSDHLTSIS